MKLRGIATAVAFGVIASALTALPAQASQVKISSTADATNAVGLIVKYKTGVSRVAPNGEPTGQNTAGVELSNVRDIGGSLSAVTFAKDLSNSEAQDALTRLQQDPRVASVEFDRFVETASYSAPILPQIVHALSPVELPVVSRASITKASVSSVLATDAWTSGYSPRVTVTWVKPAGRYTGTIVGYRVQLYAGSVWRTLKSQTAASIRSITTGSSYLKVGTSTRFRVAALTKKSGVTYVGNYGYATATPTSIPQSKQILTVQNNLNSLVVSWNPYSTAYDKGGLDVSYSVAVTDPSNNSLICDILDPTLSSCSVSNLQQGINYTAHLMVSNSHGSVTIVKSLLYTTAVASTASTNPDYNKQWFLNSNQTYSANVSAAWAQETGLDSIVVAILDTGYTDHVDISPSRILPGYDMISNAASAHDGDGRDADAHDNGDYVLGANAEDSSWHGTHVMGIIGADDNNLGGLGIAPHVKLLPVRVLGANGGITSDIIAGIYWASGKTVGGVANPNPANVINMSIGGESLSGCDSGTETALAYAKSHGVTVVTSAGNDNGTVNRSAFASLSYPGNCYPTINVGSTGKDGKPAFYSDFSNLPDQYSTTSYGVDVSAPGGDSCQGGDTAEIYSTVNAGHTTPTTSSYAYYMGTSMAAPVVSGIAALMYSAKKRQNPSVVFDDAFVTRVYRALIDTATPFASGHQNPVNCGNLSYFENGNNYGGYGSGIVNAQAALTAILQ